MKENKGITLIALVITIIILLILAGVSISLTLGQNGILNRAVVAGEENDKATLKEQLELKLAAIQMDKLTEGKILKISDLTLLNDDVFHVENVSDFPVLVTTSTYEYEIDNNFKVSYVSKTKGLKVKYTLSTTDWTQNDVTITINATSTEGTVREYLTPSGLTKNGDGTFTANQNGTYTFDLSDSAGNVTEVDIEIKNIDKEFPPTFAPTISDVKTSGFKITANAVDNEGGSGIASYEYHVGDKTYSSEEGTKVIDKLNAATEYTIYVVATDKAGNSTTSTSIKQTTNDSRLNYGTLTADGIFNCLGDDGVYYLDKNIDPKQTDAIPTKAFDGNESTYHEFARKNGYCIICMG